MSDKFKHMNLAEVEYSVNNEMRWAYSLSPTIHIAKSVQLKQLHACIFVENLFVASVSREWRPVRAPTSDLPLIFDTS